MAECLALLRAAWFLLREIPLTCRGAGPAKDIPEFNGFLKRSLNGAPELRVAIGRLELCQPMRALIGLFVNDFDLGRTPPG